VAKSRKHTKRADHYRTMAEGYEILRSPLADSYNAAAEHYRESDPPVDLLPDSTDGSGPGELK
jgi:hypothetical protein